MISDNRITDHTSYPVYVIARYTAIFALLGHTLFFFLFVNLGIRPLIYVNIASCAVFLAAFFLNNLRYHRLIFVLAFLEITFHAFIATWYLGWRSGFHLYILCLIPLIHNYRILTRAWKYLALGILILCIVLLNLLSRDWGTACAIPAGVLNNIELMNFMLACAVFMILSATYSVSAMDMENRLRIKNEELEAISRMDPLTGLSNRRDIMDKIGCEKEKMRRNGHDACLVLADIDHFKNINDTYGHNFGDLILRQLSEILRSGLRKQDHVCRWGGEEFLLVLPDTALPGGRIVAEKLRKNVEDFRFTANGKRIGITLTFGVAPYDTSQDIDVSVKLADTLLYRGKTNGRNRVESP